MNYDLTMATKSETELSEDNKELPEENKSSDNASGGAFRLVSSENVKFWDAKLTHINTVKDVRVRADKSDPRITGICVLDNGHIVLCDHSNSKVKFLDDNSTNVKYDILCENAPFDVALMDEKNVVMTMPEAQKLQFVIVKPGAKLDNTIKVSGECYGIAVHEKNIYVCIPEKGIHILSDTGILQSAITHESAGIPKYICLNADGTKLCCSGGSDIEAFVSYFTKDGHGIFKFTDEIQSPASLSMDKEENVLVLDSGANKINVISNNGANRQLLLYKRDKTHALTTMFHNVQFGKLVVACTGRGNWKLKGEQLVSKLKFYKLDMLETQPKSRRSMLSSIRQKWRK